MTKHYQQFANSFTTITRNNGDEIYVLKDDAPEEYTDIVYQLHGNSGPDDVIYREIVMCARHLADDEELEMYPEADDYTSDRLAWFADNTSECDDLLADLGVDKNAHSMLDLIGMAQESARFAMCQELKDALDLLEDDEEETDEE